MNKLGYCYHISERNTENLYTLNSSIEELMKTNETLKQFEKIEFDIEGCYSDKNLKLVVNYKTKEGKEGSELFTSHVDHGAIQFSPEDIQAYFGMEKFSDMKSTLEEHYNILEADYLEKNEPELFNQLAESYLLDCSPNTENGAEFTKEDEIFFAELLKK